MAGDYDVFLSYARKDGEAVRALVEALRGQRLAVWFDERDIESFQDITTGIVDGLGNSRALVAYYSRTYLQRRACQWELTAALLALQNPAEAQRRILVVNPEPEPTHISPAELRGALYRRAPELGDAEGLRRLVSEIARHVGQLSGSLAIGQPLSRPRWLPVQRGSTRFVGRLADLFEINSVLHGSDYPASSGDFGPGMAVVQGLGGIGKTLLVEEYGLRFGPAYPGGIFWLSAPGDAAREEVLEPAQLESELLRQLGAIVALLLGQETRGMDVDQLKGLLAREIERRGESCLWVVDDLPSGLDPKSARQWFSPHPKARTLITTRSRQYKALAQLIQLGVLSGEDAFQLLTSRRRPEGKLEVAAARSLVGDLGYHALAVDVAGAALNVRRGRQSFSDFRAELADPEEDELEYAAEMVDDLPGQQGPSIAATLLRSIRRLGEEAQDLLLLASCLAAEPIPPRLLEEIFQWMDGLRPQTTRRRVDRALKEAELLSLVERVGESGDCKVHRLISRTMRFHKPSSERRQGLQAVAVEVLGEWLAEGVDQSEHAELAPLVPHARELAVRPKSIEEAYLLGWVARYDLERGAYASASSLYKQQLDASRWLLGEEHPDTLTVMNNLASALLAQGELRPARALQEKVLEASHRLLGEEHPDTLQAMGNLARILANQGELGAAGALQEKVLEATRRLFEEYPDLLTATLTAMTNLASTLANQGELGRARALQEDVLAASGDEGEEDRDTLTAMNNLARTLLAQGELRPARALQEKVLEASHRLLGEEHPDTLLAMANLASTLASQGELGPARALQEQLLEGRRRLLGEEHPDTLLAMGHLGGTLSAQGELRPARALQEKVLEASHRLLGEEHPDTLLAMGNLASTLARQRELGPARALKEQVLEAHRRLLGDEHPSTLTAMNNLSVTLADLGELREARVLQQRALEAHRRLLGKEHPNTLIAMANLASTLADLGERRRARVLWERVLKARRRLLGEEHPDTLVAVTILASMPQELSE